MPPLPSHCNMARCFTAQPDSRWRYRTQHSAMPLSDVRALLLRPLPWRGDTPLAPTAPIPRLRPSTTQHFAWPATPPPPAGWRTVPPLRLHTARMARAHIAMNRQLILALNQPCSIRRTASSCDGALFAAAIPDIIQCFTSDGRLPPDEGDPRPPFQTVGDLRPLCDNQTLPASVTFAVRGIILTVQLDSRTPFPLLLPDVPTLGTLPPPPPRLSLTT